MPIIETAIKRIYLTDLTVPGHPEIFVVGDTASLDQDGKPLPGVAQVAMQQGRYAGKLIHRRVTGKSTPGPFRYFDKGSMAVVGKSFAVLQTGKIHISGFPAWLAWAAVHLEFLAQASLRVSVFVQWVWTGLTGQKRKRKEYENDRSNPISHRRPGSRRRRSASSLHSMSTASLPRARSGTSIHSTSGAWN